MPLDLFGAPPDRKPLRVVAFRQKSIRLECRDCGIRFSIDPENFADIVARKHAPPPQAMEAQARTMTAEAPGKYLSALAAVKQTVERRLDDERRQIVDLHRQGVQAATPRKRPIRFPPRSVEQPR